VEYTADTLAKYLHSLEGDKTFSLRTATHGLLGAARNCYRSLQPHPQFLLQCRNTPHAHTYAHRAILFVVDLRQVRFVEGYYLVLLKGEQALVSELAGHEIYRVAEMELVALSAKDPGWSFRETTEAKYMKMFGAHLFEKDFYFSYSYDLTRSVQLNAVDAAEPAGGEPDSPRDSAPSAGESAKVSPWRRWARGGEDGACGAGHAPRQLWPIRHHFLWNHFLLSQLSEGSRSKSQIQEWVAGSRQATHSMPPTAAEVKTAEAARNCVELAVEEWVASEMTVAVICGFVSQRRLSIFGRPVVISLVRAPVLLLARLKPCTRIGFVLAGDGTAESILGP
jgi:hypothetical protein